MELLKKAKRKTEVNPEGSTVLARKSEIQLYLEASNLNLKKNSFYKYAEDKLEGFLKLGKEVDEAFVLGLAKFLSDRGLKTSPVILTSVLSDRKFSFREHPKVIDIFNTPNRLAEAVALSNLKKVKLNNSFKKNILKIALQNMQEHTLKKNKLKHKEIKLRDLIKLFRPKPRDEKISKLYKAIIENTKEASLKETEENIVAIKSSTRLGKETKKKILKSEAMLDKVPVNQLIRNLKFYAEEYDFKNNLEVQEKVHKRLESINNYRILNIFDIITASIYVPQFEKLLFEIVKKFVEETKKAFDYGEEITILFDTSYSMQGEGVRKGFLYLVLFSALFNKVNLRCFSDELFSESKTLERIILKIRLGSISEAYQNFRTYFSKYSGGTALIESMRDLIEEKPEEKNYIVISDEVSWQEGSYLVNEINSLSGMLKNKNLILINPEVYKGTVFKENVVAVSSLNPSILLDMAILFDENGFIKFIKEYDTAKPQTQTG
jgi:hypothetical protein